MTALVGGKSPLVVHQHQRLRKIPNMRISKLLTGPIRFLLPTIGVTIFALFVLLPTAISVPASHARDMPDDSALLVNGVNPESAPDAPNISIASTGANIELSWEHADITTASYQIWRSVNQPYFEPPGAGQMIDNYSFPTALYGIFEPFAYIDDGVCGYFTAPPSAPGCTNPQSPAETILGDVADNYTWVVRVGSTSTEYDTSNRVGEFDFAIVPGS